MLRSLVTYRGIRIRKVHQHMKGITFIIGLLPFLLANVFYHYTHYQTATAHPISYGIVAFIMLLVPVVLVLIINKLCYDKLFFFSLLDNLRVISNFLIQNGYYLIKKNAEGKDRIKLPKVYLKRDRFGLDVTFILQGNKFQDRFNNLNSQLELMFDGDFMSKTYSKGFVTYTIVLDHIAGRLPIDKVEVDDKGLRLMEDVWWNYDAEPHLLVAGGTGGGKTVLLMSILKALLKVGYVDIGDPKKLDLASLKAIPVFRGRVFSSKEDIAQMLQDNAKEVHERGAYMSNHPEHEIGKNYVAYGLKPKFVLIDEWAALMAKLANDYKTKAIVDEAVRTIVLEGRQAGVFMIMSMQRPDGEFIETALRDNFFKRIATGYLEKMGNQMMFGSANSDKVFKRIDTINGKKVFGRGYVANFGQLAQEFFSPLVPFEEGYSFVKVFQSMEPLEEQDLSLNKPSDASPEHVSEPLEKKEEDISMPEEDLVTLSQAEKQTMLPESRLIKLVSEMERGGYRKFRKSSEGKTLFSVEDIEFLNTLRVYKGENAIAWDTVVLAYFSKGE
ncbi:TPA: cell division protein FtsK [Streptococcus pyogenes]|nr:cell division protein FtsK [Streptococcus pyogenes]